MNIKKTYYSFKLKIYLYLKMNSLLDIKNELSTMNYTPKNTLIPISFEDFFEKKLLFSNNMFHLYEAYTKENGVKISVYLIQYDFLDFDPQKIDEQLSNIFNEVSMDKFILKKHGYCFNSERTILYITYHKESTSFINPNLFLVYDKVNPTLIYLELLYELIIMIETMHLNEKFLLFIHPNLLFFDNSNLKKKQNKFIFYDNLISELFKMKYKLFKKEVEVADSENNSEVESQVNKKNEYQNYAFQERRPNHILNYFFLYNDASIKNLRKNDLNFFKLDIQSLFLLFIYYFSFNPKTSSHVSYERLSVEFMKDYLNNDSSFSNSLKYVTNKEVKDFLLNNMNLDFREYSSISEIKSNFEILRKEIISSSSCEDCLLNNNDIFNLDNVNHNNNTNSIYLNSHNTKGKDNSTIRTSIYSQQQQQNKKINFSCLKLICETCIEEHFDRCRVCQVFKKIDLQSFFDERSERFSESIIKSDLSSSLIYPDLINIYKESIESIIKEITFNLNSLINQVLMNEHKINSLISFLQRLLSQKNEKSLGEYLKVYEELYKKTIAKANTEKQISPTKTKTTQVELEGNKENLNKIIKYENELNRLGNELSSLIDKMEEKKNYINNLNVNYAIDRLKYFTVNYLNRLIQCNKVLLPTVCNELKNNLLSYFETEFDDKYFISKYIDEKNYHLEFEKFTKYNTYIACVDYVNSYIHLFNIESNQAKVIKLNQQNIILQGSKYVNMKNKIIVSGGMIDGELDKNIVNTVWYIDYCLISNDDYEFTPKNDIKLELRDVKYLSPMSKPRERHSIITYGSIFLIVCGGSDTNTCEKYNFLKDKWEMLPSISSSKYDTSLCLVNKVDLYLFFGSINTIVNGKNQVKSVFEIERLKLYDDSNLWEKINIMFDVGNPIHIRTLSGIIPYSDNFIYLVGGRLESKQSTIETLKYDIEKNTVVVDRINTIYKPLYFQESVFVRINDIEYASFAADNKNSLVKLTYK